MTIKVEGRLVGFTKIEVHGRAGGAMTVVGVLVLIQAIALATAAIVVGSLGGLL